VFGMGILVGILLIVVGQTTGNSNWLGLVLGAGMGILLGVMQTNRTENLVTKDGEEPE